MSDTPVVFDDGSAYEHFMGRWSRAAGGVFLDWVAPPKNARWLDVGCGTGVFTQLILDMCSPAEVIAIDPAPAQIDFARNQPVGRLADLRVGDAQELPFCDHSFDVVALALVLNFIPDRPRALGEARRVGRPGCLVAAYVWNFAEARGTGWPLAYGMNQIGLQLPMLPGSQDTRLEALNALFQHAGFENVANRTIDVSVSYNSFDEFWSSQASPFTPYGKMIAGLSVADRSRLIEVVKAHFPISSTGHFDYQARVHAVKCNVPT